MFEASLFDELEALYPDSDTADGTKTYSVAGANGTYAGVHIFMSGLTPGIPVSVAARGPHTAFRLFELIPVPVEINTGYKLRSEYLRGRATDTVVRKAPFYIYEALKPMYNLFMPAGVSAACAFKTKIEYAREKTEAVWEIDVQHAGQTQTLRLKVLSYPCSVKKAGADTHRYVNWISYENISRYHHVQPESPEYFRLLDRYLRTAAYCRQNIMPLPTSGMFSLKDGIVTLDENRLDKYLEAGRRAGFELFEGHAFCGRAEGVADNDAFYNSLDHSKIENPDAVADAFRDAAFDKFDNGTKAKVFLTGDDPEGERGAAVLAAQARVLYKYIESRGLKGAWEQCCLDEPNDALAKAYRRITDIVKKEMPGVPILEPVLPTHELTGCVDIWCPTIDTYENDREYYDSRVANGDRLYVYTCLTPGGNYMNRMLDMQRVRCVYLGWAAALYTNVKGYLHWGYNSYTGGVNPYERSACMFSEQAMEFHPKRALFLPAGDYCIVYPGDDGALISTRSEAQRLGLEDLELLLTLDDDKRLEIVKRVVRGYADYDKDVSEYRKAKLLLLEEACAMTIQVLDYSPEWRGAFERIAVRLRAALGKTAIAIEHVGSTSVIGLKAKPIIDIDVVVETEADIDLAADALKTIGYAREGDLGVKGREAFKYEGSEILPRHHLYVCEKNSRELIRHLALRNYLREHSAAAKEYGDVKSEGARLYPNDIDAYISHKSAFINGIYEKCGVQTDADVGEGIQR